MKKLITAIFLSISILSYGQQPTLDWSVTQGAFSGTDKGIDVITDASGNVYVTGEFYGTVDFEPGTGITSKTSVGSKDVFIQKLDSTGTLIWIKSFGGGGIDEVGDIELDQNGDIYLTGRFNNTVDFDPGTAGFNVISNGMTDVYLLKLSSLGNFIWVKTIGGTSIDNSDGLVVDKNNNPIITGSFVDSVDFDPGSGEYKLSNLAGSNIFVLKLNSSGNFVYANALRGTSAGVGIDLKVDTSNNLFLLGHYMGTYDFDPGNGTYFVSSSSGNGANPFVEKFDSSGNFIWVKTVEANAGYTSELEIDSKGNIYFIGFFKGIIDVDPGLGLTSLYSTHPNYFDAFIQKLDKNGNLVWFNRLVGSENDYGRGIAIDSYDNIYLTGEFRSQVEVDFDSIKKKYLTAVGSSSRPDIFVEKIDSSGNYIWALSFGTTQDDKGYGITVDNNNNVYLSATREGKAFIQKIRQCFIDTSVSVTDSTLTANEIGATYQWLDCDNNDFPIVGAFTKTYQPIVTGNYKLRVTNSRCSDTSTCFRIVVVPNTSSLSEKENNMTIKVYPNPNEGSFSIRTKSPEKVQLVQLIDLKGSHVETLIVEQKGEVFMLSTACEPGVYILKVQTAKEVISTKLIIK